MSFLFNLGTTLGAAFIGYSISCIIFGISTMQTISYFIHYRRDPLNLKILVGFIWCTELIHQSLIAHALYHYTVSLFGSPLAVVSEPVIWSLVTQVLVGAISGSIVKICFIIRVWKFSNHNIFVTASLSIVVIAQIGSILAWVVGAFRLKNILDSASIKVVASLSLGMGALADLLIAVALCYYLRKLRTGYKESDSLLNTLVQYALNSGAITSVLSVMTLILYDARTLTFQYMAVYFVLSKMFAVSLMGALGTRKLVANNITEHFTQTNGMATHHFAMLSVMDSLPPTVSIVDSIPPNYTEPRAIQASTQASDTDLEFNAWNLDDKSTPRLQPLRRKTEDV
ncbi:hypothetical protein GYMLUDRAFT_34691 [Collybiopsis luxurians FD-317 M1]|nr:hypothetical protein GYMLUDRAFT_34691 [Collybiopsis luxurians FD-317 M1]